MRKTKRPNGTLIEEGAAHTIHAIQRGVWQMHDSDFDDYTGRFCFRFADGRQTRWYTERTTPAWLLALYHELIGKEAEVKNG